MKILARRHGQDRSQRRRPALLRRKARSDDPGQNRASDPAGESSLGADEDTVDRSTWTAGHTAGVSALRGALWVALGCAPVALIVALLTASSADTMVAQAGGQDSTQELPAAGEFTERYVETWLETDADSTGRLDDFVELSEEARWADDPAADAQAAEVAGATRDGDFWSITVGVDVRPTGDDATYRRYYQVAVDYQDGALVALTLPAPVPAPSTGEPPALDYTNDASLDTPLGSTIGSFLSAFLTGSGDLSRYVTPGAAIRAVSPPPYSQVKVDAVQSELDMTALPDRPADGTQAHVLVTASAETASGGSVPVTYALTVQTRDGRWEIAAIDTTPQVEPATTATDEN